MKIILILYFFILFILLVPGLLLKQSSLLHSLLFALLLYFTFPIIDKSIHENFKQNDVNVSFSNTISSAPQGNSLGNLLVSAFEELSEMQVNIAHGKKILAAANGGEEEINELKELIDKTEMTLKKLKIRYAKLEDMKDSVKELTTTYNTLVVKDKKLTEDFDKCELKTVNGEGLIFKKGEDIKKIKKDIKAKTSETVKLNGLTKLTENKFPSMNKKIKDKIQKCNLQHLNDPWIKEYV